MEKPPAVLMQETLAQMATTLATVETHQRTVQPALDDLRAVVTAATQGMHRQTSEVLQRLDGLHQAVAQLTPPHHMPAWVGWVCGGLAGVLLMGTVWGLYPRPVSPAEHLAGAVDTVLRDQFTSLPKTVQEQVAAAYQRVGLQSPGQRQKGSTK